MSVVRYSLIKSKKGQKMNNLQIAKTLEMLKKYENAGIQLTNAEKNLLKYLLSQR